MATREETTLVNIPNEYIRDEIKSVEQKLQEKQIILTDIGKELYLLRTTGIFNYINTINPQDMLFYIIIILIIVLLSPYIEWNIKYVMGLVIGLSLVYYLNEGRRATIIDRLKMTEIQMEQIQPKPKFFYHDANFIEFAYNMLSYRVYNPTAYSKMIQSIDNFLQIQIDIENKALQNCTETYNVAIDMMHSALNSLHSIIHSMPTDEQQIGEIKLQNAIKTLQLYMQRHLDVMSDICNQRSLDKGWNRTTKMIDKYAIPGIDKIKTTTFNLF